LYINLFYKIFENSNFYGIIYSIFVYAIRKEEEILNQILDHSGPKQARPGKNPADTLKIIRVYAILIIFFGIFFIAKGSYTLSKNKEFQKSQINDQKFAGPLIELYADKDELSISVSYDSSIESISYQWYRGIVTPDEIKEYEANREEKSNSSDENDDEIEEESDDIAALGKLEEKKLSNEKNVKLEKIGIPRGDTTVRIIVRATDNTVAEYIQSYHTDVGVDKIEPEIKISLKGTVLTVIATDETEISKLIYTIGDKDSVEITDRQDKKTIKTEIVLDKVEMNDITINAVDKAQNTGTYNQEVDFYVGKPEINFDAEPDLSKIYVLVAYPKGITKIEYEFNGEKFVKEFDNPSENKEIEIALDTIEGYNRVDVKVYTEEEQVYAEDYGECEYNP